MTVRTFAAGNPGIKGPADAVQKVSLTGSPTGGTFTLSFGGNTTSAIAFNAANTAVQSALTALASIGVGNVTVSKGTSWWIVSFKSALAATGVATMTINASGLTGGSSPSGNVTVLQAGVARYTSGLASLSYVVHTPPAWITQSYTSFTWGMATLVRIPTTGQLWPRGDPTLHT